MCRMSSNLGASTSWNPRGPVQACNGIALPFTLKDKKFSLYLILNCLPVCPLCFNKHQNLVVLAVIVYIVIIWSHNKMYPLKYQFSVSCTCNKITISCDVTPCSRAAHFLTPVSSHLSTSVFCECVFHSSLADWFVLSCRKTGAPMHDPAVPLQSPEGTLTSCKYPLSAPTFYVSRHTFCHAFNPTVRFFECTMPSPPYPRGTWYVGGFIY
jgi:hypothetical protein